MTDPTDGLRAFLIARWGEEAQHAHNALEWLDGENWTAILPEDEWLARKPNMPLAVRLFVTQQSPQHVIDDLAAKARILQHLTEELEDRGGDNPWWYDAKLTPILEALALPYREHPDYQRRWSPDA